MSLGRSQKAAPCSIQAAEERELKLLKRIRREVRPSMDRGGSRGAAHNRGSRGWLLSCLLHKPFRYHRGRGGKNSGELK